MTKRPSYRVNFTMPKADNELNQKIRELFERHRDMGNLRNWLMQLAIKEAQRELGGYTPPPKAVTPPPAPPKPKKAESFADLLPDGGEGELQAGGDESKAAALYDSLREVARKDGLDSQEWDEFFERNKPKTLS